MSKFTTDTINNISPYVPGEQPKGKKFIKLNTNENPYFTCGDAVKSINEDVLKNLNRYSDPESSVLVNAIAEYYKVDKSNVLVTNGSDESLAFAFFAYGKCGVCYPDVTYGFYDVIAKLFGCPIEHVALKDDFTVDEADYYNRGKTVVLANPNAQTGIELSKSAVERILQKNKDGVVIVDQAYADFGQCNVIDLVKKYSNLIVVNTFSKSRSLAGARVGYTIADSALIDDLKKVKNSFHPYNVNSVSAALATSAIIAQSYFLQSVEKIKSTRKRLNEGLIKLNFNVLPSAANFVMAESSIISGRELYEKLKENGILVRHFNDKRISGFVRITVGTDGETEALLASIEKVLKEKQL